MELPLKEPAERRRKHFKNALFFRIFSQLCLGSSLTLLDINKSLCIEKIHSRVIGNNVCANRLSYINVLKICSSATDFFRALGPKIVKILYRIIK